MYVFTFLPPTQCGMMATTQDFDPTAGTQESWPWVALGTLLLFSGPEFLYNASDKDDKSLAGVRRGSHEVWEGSMAPGLWGCVSQCDPWKQLTSSCLCLLFAVVPCPTSDFSLPPMVRILLSLRIWYFKVFSGSLFSHTPPMI